MQLRVELARLALVLVSDRDVDLLQGDRRRRLLDLGLHRFDADPRMAPREGRDGGGHDVQEGGLERRDTHGAHGLARSDGCHFRLGDLGRAEQLIGVGGEELAGGGEPEIASHSLEQHGTGLALEHAELLGDGPRRVSQCGGRGTHRSARLELPE